MEIIRQERQKLGLSQRKFAAKVGVSFRTLQQLENGQANPRLSTLTKILDALGYHQALSNKAITRYRDWNRNFLEQNSIEEVSRQIATSRNNDWRLWLFNFVDAFRATPSAALIEAPPVPNTLVTHRCLIASTVETLCEEQAPEQNITIPWWCGSAGTLPQPFFVANVENLKAMALVESPIHFRKRNIFVLDNFLARA
ncbi:MAG: helix-turn-helix transcriptional regulator [Deltaproteobacteria bacterium]|nr:helix-turn-helix transcriptional regulator [Deltaproteobacteria bacterium]